MFFDVVVAGFDVVYVDALVRYLVTSHKNNLIVRAVYDSGQLMALMEEAPLVCGLVEEALFHSLDEAFLTTNSQRLLTLTETLTQVNLHDYKGLLRYQKGSSIEKALLAFLLDRCQGELVAGTHSGLVTAGFFSPSGGVGTTTVALATALLKAKEGHKTLFISLDNYQSFDRLLRADNDHTMTDYITYIKSHDQWFLGLSAMVSEDQATGLHFLKPMLYELDRRAMPPEAWMEWLTYMIERSDYHYLVIDLNGGDFEESITWLNHCQRKVFVLGNDVRSSEKWHKFRNQVIAMGDEDCLKDAVCVTSGLVDRKQHSMADVDNHFPYDANIIVGGGHEGDRLNLNGRAIVKLKEMIEGV